MAGSGEGEIKEIVQHDASSTNENYGIGLHRK